MTNIVCKCGVSRLEDIQCAECGEALRLAWIPVSERLPEIGVEVFVLDKCGECDTDKRYKRVNGDVVWLTSEEIVTHWMPLPERPPEAE